MVLFRARAARRTCAFAGAASYGVGRASRASGLHGQLGARRAGGGSAPQKLGSTAACGFSARRLVAKRRRASLGRGRVGTASVDRWTQRPPCKSKAISQGCSPTLFQVAVAPGGHTARASSRRCPLLDTRAAAPGGVLRSTTQSSLLGAAPRPPWSPRSSATGSRPTSTSSRAGPQSQSSRYS